MDGAIQQFLEITRIDSREIAEYYLNVSDGDLQAAITMLFEDGGTSGQSSSQATESDRQAHIVASGDGDPEIKILEWNIQSLLEDCLEERMVAIVNIIKQHQPAVIMLQEVILETFLYLKSALKPNYVGFSPAESSVCGSYFVAIFVDKNIFKSYVAKVLPFPQSQQARQILVVEGRCYDRDITIMTSHLESTKSGEPERKRQIATLYLVMNEVHPSRTVIFGGDTNLRDAEFNSLVKSEKFDVKKVNDVWDVLGSPQNARYSWDLANNDNQIQGGKARLRFERMYIRVEDVADKQYFKPKDMKFVGMDRLPCGKFPSDHWGILATFCVRRHIHII